MSPFFAMYGYNPEIHYDVEGNVSGERVPVARERISSLHELRETLEQRWLQVAET